MPQKTPSTEIQGENKSVQCSFDLGAEEENEDPLAEPVTEQGEASPASSVVSLFSRRPKSIQFDLSQFKVIESTIGSNSRLEGWPTADLAGLVRALTIWTLDPLCDVGGHEQDHPHAKFDAPFRSLAWTDCIEQYDAKTGRLNYVATRPVHSEHPNAVRYCGSFLSYSYGFCLDTDDPALIEFLDGLIAANMQRPAYTQALKKYHDRFKKRAWRPAA